MQHPPDLRFLCAAVTVTTQSSGKMAADGSAHNVRYYEKEFPDVEEAVMVNVKRIAEMGAYVTVRFRSPARRPPPPPTHPPSLPSR